MHRIKFNGITIDLDNNNSNKAKPYSNIVENEQSKATDTDNNNNTDDNKTKRNRDREKFYYKSEKIIHTHYFAGKKKNIGFNIFSHIAFIIKTPFDCLK